MVDTLSRALHTMAQQVQAAPDPQGTLDGIALAAVEVVDGAEYAAITMVVGGKHLQTVAATDQVARDVDQVQYDTQQGPCLDALYEHDVIQMHDMDSEQRWPDFTRRARDHGVRSMMCFRLFVQDRDAAALNLYASGADAFSADAQDAGRMLATHAAVALSAARRIDNLQRAVDSRDLIGQAKGVLMERHGLTADAAFSVLVRASQDENIKLIEVARTVASRD